MRINVSVGGARKVFGVMVEKVLGEGEDGGESSGARARGLGLFGGDLSIVVK